MRLYNTLSGKKEELPITKGKKLRLFVCGPTVYDCSHIGHARTYLFFDFLARYLRKQGHKLFFVENITNVDDKIIRRAREEKKDALKVADFFTKAYLADMKALGITAVDAYAPATKFIPEIVKQVQTLIQKRYAYKIEGDGWYYDISKFSDYGKLSHRTSAQAEDAVTRIDESIKKRNKGDFCVWKFSKPNEPIWDSPLGAGRPGWHIEDTAISEKYFGPQYELHGGGMDLKFPHHEAEIAQAEAASGKKPFVKVWIHTGMLTVRGEKMSKSLGNFITIRDFLKHHSPASPIGGPASLRFAYFSHHYRTPVDYTEGLIRNAEQALLSIAVFLGKLNFLAVSKMATGSKKVLLKDFEDKFRDALEDDANTPRALAAVFEFASETNKILWQIDKKSARAARQSILKALQLFGITLPSPEIPSKIKRLAEERELSRRSKQFAQSDALRKRINALGYILEDTPIGSFLWPNAPRQPQRSPRRT